MPPGRRRGSEACATGLHHPGKDADPVTTAFAIDPGTIAASAYAALAASLDEGLLSPEDAEVFRAAADARLFGEADLEARMHTVYHLLLRLCAPGAEHDVRAIRRLRNQLFSIRRAV